MRKTVALVAGLMAMSSIALAAPAPIFQAPFDGQMQATWKGGQVLTPMSSMSGPFVKGVRGQARVLGGRNTAVYYVEDGFPPPQGTASLWVKPMDWTPGGSDHFVFFLSFNYPAAEGGYVRVILYKVYNDTNLTLLVQDTVGQNRTSMIHAPIEFWQKSVWHHLAFTWDAQQIRLYVDGKRVGEAAAAPLPAGGRWEIRVGTPYLSWIHVGNEINAIDDVRIWDVALSDEEIKQMYDEIAPNLPPPPEQPQAATGAQPENLALRRNGAFLLASSFRDYTTHYPGNLLDGDRDTVWQPFEAGNPEWLEVRWPLPVQLDRVVLRPADGGAVKGVTLQEWDAGTGEWRPLPAQRADGEGITLKFPVTQLQRLRVELTPAASAPLILSELEAYGPPQPIISRLEPYWTASYIWYPESGEVYQPNKPRYFRQTFEVADPAQVRSATLQLRSNDHYRAWVNGVEVATGSKDVVPVEVASKLVKGRNVLAVEATLTSNPGRWGWGELLYELAINYDDHTQYVASGAKTRTSDAAPTGWLTAAFDDGAWKPAAVFVKPPDGVWGEIPYHAKPVGEKAQVERFRVQPETLHPGDTLTAEVTLKAPAGLHDDYVFVLDVGEESQFPASDNFDVAATTLQPQPPTSQWLAGEAQTMSFRLTLPNYAPNGRVPVRLEGYGMRHGTPLELGEADGRLGEIEIHRPGMDVAAPATPKLNFSRGAAALLRDGRITPPAFWALRANSWERYQLYGSTGLHVYHVQSTPEKIDDTPETLARVNRFLEERMATVLRVDPRAQFIVDLDLRPSATWLEANPKERLVTAQGTQGPVSYCSTKYFATVDHFLAGVIGYLKSRPYYGRIIGYLPMSCGAPDSTMGGTESDLFQKDRSKLTVGDFNPQAIAAFRQWLRDKYGGSEQRLQHGWHDPQVTFETATPVISRLVRPGVDGGVFRDPLNSGMTLDYFDFLSGVMGRFYSHVMATVKRLAGPAVMVGTYYGYNVAHLRGYNSPGSIFNGNNFDLYQRLSDPDWDFFASPLPYEARRAGMPFKSYQAQASILLHHKLLINEMDHRTFVAMPVTYGRLRSDRETEAVLERDIGGSLVDGSGYWFADWSGTRGRDGVGFFTAPSILRTIRETTAAAATVLQRPKQGGVQVALFVHGATMGCQDVYRSAPIYHNLVARTVWEEMSRMGAPFDTYLLEDLADPRVRSGYKLYIFLNPFLLNEQQRKMIDSLKRDGKTLLFFYAPGYADRETGLRDEHIERVCGFRVQHGPAHGIMRYRLTNTDSPITKGLPAGKEYAIEAFPNELSRQLHPPDFSPVFRIVDPRATTLATYPDGGVALAARDMGDWKSVYCTVPYMASEVLRGVCRYAGVHLYCTEDVILKADNRCLMVHNGFEAPRDLTISLPQVEDVVDLISGKPVASGARSFPLHLEEDQTRLLGLSATDGE